MDVMLVQDPGLSSTLQDRGRRGGLESGIPPGGAADDYAYRLNCLVLGNPAGAAVVEQILKGGRYQALAPVTVALTGADLAAAVNGTSIPLATPITLKRGDLLETRVARRGCFGYLGVAGGGLAGYPRIRQHIHLPRRSARRPRRPDAQGRRRAGPGFRPGRVRPNGGGDG